MKERDLKKFKIMQKYSILEFMGIMGIAGLVLTLSIGLLV